MHKARFLFLGVLFSMALALLACTGAQAQSTSPAAQVVLPKGQQVPYPAAMPVAAPAMAKSITIEATNAVIEIAPGVKYLAWTFNGSVPGPLVRVRQGDTVEFTLLNKSDAPISGLAVQDNFLAGHSMDFHAARTPWDKNYRTIGPGQSINFTWKAEYPGVFMYHCGTGPALEHIGNGMYGAIVVDPTTPLPKADREYFLVQSEFYTEPSKYPGVLKGSFDRMLNGSPEYVVFNGRANQYKDNPLEAKAGERIRLYVLNAGPNHTSSFHVVGTVFDKVYVEGNPANLLRGIQTQLLAASGGAIFEFTIPDPGLYPIVTHAFNEASKGALGLIKVTGAGGEGSSTEGAAGH